MTADQEVLHVEPEAVRKVREHVLSVRIIGAHLDAGAIPGIGGGAIEREGRVKRLSIAALVVELAGVEGGRAVQRAGCDGEADADRGAVDELTAPPGPQPD